MQRTLAIAAALTAFVAGRYTARQDAAKPVVTVQREVETIAVACPPTRVVEIVEAAPEEEPDDDPDAIEAEESETMRKVDSESKRIAELESSLGPQGALRGQVKDTKTAESLAGVTIVASIGTDIFTAITDENGWYEIQPIPTGRYTVTAYYAENTVEHRDIAVEGRRVTPLFAKIDSSSPEVDENLGHGITIGKSYTDDFPNEPQSEDPCALGVTFSGSTSLENEYYD